MFSEKYAAYQDDAVESLLEPRHRVLLLNTVLEANPSLLSLSPRNTGTRPSHHNVEVHAEDTNVRVVTRTQIDVLGDTESKVPSF